LRDADFKDRDRVLHYSHRSHDGSLLGPWLRRSICVKLLPYIPLNISANALTITGHIAVVIGFLCSMAVSRGPLVEWSATRWISLVPAAALTVYLIADEIDGMQARRIGASGPLGDFMDAWLDTLAGFLVPLSAIAAYGATPVLTVAFVILCGLAWWTVHAERWVTGELRLPRISEIEMIAIVMAIHLIAAILGPQIWQTTVLGVTLIDGVVWFGIASVTILIVTAGVRAGPARRSIPGFLATLAPLVTWYSVLIVAVPPVASSVAVPLIFGMAIAAHIGELQRRRLIGTREQPYDTLLVVIGGLLLLSLLPADFRTPATAGSITWAAALAIAIRLAHQFAQTVRYIVDRRGDSLFAIPSRARPGTL
jgi:phosphatidylglycerophosphate synthase